MDTRDPSWLPQSPPLIRRHMITRGFVSTHFRVGLNQRLAFRRKQEQDDWSARCHSGYGERTARLSIWRRLPVRPRREATSCCEPSCLGALSSVGQIQVGSQSSHFVFTSSSRVAIQYGPRSSQKPKGISNFRSLFRSLVSLTRHFSHSCFVGNAGQHTTEFHLQETLLVSSNSL